MNKKIHSLALLVNLGIYGVALPAMADDNTATAQHEDTMVITAKTRPRGTWLKSSAPCRAST